MGLFDNIIGTATEGVEPLGMDTILDDSTPQGGGSGSGGSGQGGGSGSGGSGKGSGGAGSGGKKENPNVVSGDNATSIIVDQNTSKPTEIPNIDIGGDMFNFNFTPPAEIIEVPSTGGDISVPGTDSVGGITLDSGIVADNSVIIPPITSGTDVSGVINSINEVSTENEVSTSIESTIPLIDISSITEVSSVEEVTPIPDASTENGDNKTPTEITKITSVPENTIIADVEKAPEIGISPLLEEKIPVTGLNIDTKNIPDTNSEATISKTLESLNERISEFLADLEKLKADEAKLLLEKEAALVKIEAEEKLAIAKLEEEKKIIEAAVKNIQADEKKIEETIALLNNNKIV